MMVRLFSTYAELIEAACAFLKAQAPHSEVLVVGPSRSALDDLIRLHSPALAGIHRYTLRQLVGVLSEKAMAERGLAPVNFFGIEALAARAAHRLFSRKEFRYFEPVCRRPGFARSLARTLSELRLFEIPPEPVGALGPAGEDLARLGRIYEELLAESALADEARMLKLALACAKDHHLAGLPVLFFDVPVASKLSGRLCATLRGLARDSAVLLLKGDEASLRHWELAAASASTSPARTSLERMRQHLFVASSAPPQPLDGSLEVFSAASDSLECVEVARRIQEFAREGVGFDEIAVLLRSPERYQPLVEEAFARAGVDCYFTHGVVRPDPAGRAFLTLLACRLEDYPATRFAEYLSFAQTPEIGAESVPEEPVWGVEDELLFREPAAPAREARAEPSPQTPVAWEQLLVDAAVVGGRQRWQRRLSGLKQQYQLKLARVEDGDEAARQHFERQLELLENLERVALPLIERLAALPASACWGDWISHFSDLAQLALRHPDSVLLALNELWPMSEVGPLTLDEAYLVLSERMCFLRRQPTRRRYGQVWVGGIEEARGHTFRVVFLVGVSEGNFPKKSFEDPLLLDALRKKLGRDPGKQSSAGLPTRPDRIGEERFLLQVAAAAASERLIVSFSRSDVSQNRSRVPSFYALEAIRAATGRWPDLREFERLTSQGSLARLGWPAPPDPARAVDDLEFDLAWLERLAAGESGAGHGGARYLVEVNPHLARSLRARYQRWKERKWTPADGLVFPSDKRQQAQELLGRYRLRQYPWSATTLQLFAACPYRFVLHGMHHLRPRQDAAPVEEMDPVVRGEIFHRVQFELFRRTRDPDAMREIAGEVLAEVAAEYAERLKPAIPRVWQREVEDLGADLRGWLLRMQDDKRLWQPEYAELAFGLPLDEEQRDPHSRPEHATILDGIQLRGSVDWIERQAGSQQLRITDHKTGQPPKAAPSYVGGGSYLQPLLYALVAETLLGAPVAETRLYYATQRGGYQSIKFPVNEKSRRRLAEALQLIDGAIERGMLPAAPAPDACKWCDFRPVCGPREPERVSRKEPLNWLLTLRELP
ncbi:MAG: exodeoxyribonuclease V subunit gamma [Bryobacteraceae bacterium]|nr:exodeoxyribonuclease V subunit gamma [Bryobacteraceae bacterium]MDW8379215.1 PD-(D/E)XK nuclease family protein [Bryobacterales bacterium]